MMATCDILKDLREKHHLTQEELAERVLVTRQAVNMSFYDPDNNMIYFRSFS